MSKVKLTAPRVLAFTCPPGKSLAFLWDATVPGLALRTTPRGAPSYIFQGRFAGKTFRQTIGSPEAWTIPQAQDRAREIQRQVDKGRDPREIKAEATAADVAKRRADSATAVTVGQAWARYVEERRPHWGDRNYIDHLKLADKGGADRKRMPGMKTKEGPLASLMPLRLAELEGATIEAWAAREAKDRPARVRLGLRHLKAFLRWAASEPDLKDAADATAASAKKTRELAGKPKIKNDYLQREQLPAWFEHVRLIQNPVISAYLQCLLLTGTRREELAALRWEDVNFRWKGLDLKDKIEGRRAVPLTPYVAHVLNALPRANEWVFSSARFIAPTNGKEGRWENVSASGALKEPSIAHRRACTAAGLELTLHGLRRSFASLCEWIEIPGGISAQIQGHAPQGVREQNYVRRPLDLLRLHHEKIEAWILKQAGVTFESAGEPDGKSEVA